MARRKKATTTKKTTKRFRLKVYTAAYMHLTDVVPSMWHDWFFDLVADTADFTWGTNDVSLIQADSFLNYCERILVPLEADEEEGHLPQQDITDFLTRLRSLGNLYIDMECKLSVNN